MRLLVVNPNTTRSMTDTIAAAARRAASPGTEIVALNPDSGPPSIQGYYDEARSLAGLLDTVESNLDVNGIVLACFDDSGLDALRCLTAAPVLGIGEAAFHAASLLAGRFSVVTTLSRSVPAIEHNLVRYGLASRCGRVRASEVPVLELERGDPTTRSRIAAEIAEAIAVDRAEAIVLGCAGMTDLATSLSVEFGLPVLDGVVCAVGLCETLARLGLATSKIGGYSPRTGQGASRADSGTARPGDR